MKRGQLTVNSEQVTEIRIVNIFYYSLFIIFLCYLLSVLSCRNPFEPSAKEKSAEGIGYFSLSVERVSTGRTILPATVRNDFALYTLEFLATDSTANSAVTVERTNANLSNPVSLDVGDWDLYVTAYMDAQKTRPAAWGELKGIAIDSGASVSRSLTLTAVIEGGEGTFRWTINYPTSVSIAKMTIVPLDTVNGTPEQTKYFGGGTPTVSKTGSLALNSGYYHVVFYLLNNQARSVERREILHVYKNLESVFDYTFTDGHFTYLIVTSGADSGTGTLRNAISGAPADGTIIVDPSVAVISLTSRLSISKSLTIEGNGVTITRDPSWTTVDNSSQLLYLSSSSSTKVTIKRVWFKDGMARCGAAIYNYGGTVSLESCIFSGNKNSPDYSFYGGGAIYNTGTMSVKGSTFYGNRSEGYGGAICMTGTLTLEGNLFYGNTAANSYPIVYRNSGTVISGGYNVVDIALGTGSTQSGWTETTGDKTISALPVTPVTFRLLSGRGAENVITTLPEGYPTADFYGNPISDSAAAGAVQATVSGSGYYLDLTVNSSSRGNASASPSPNTDGFVSGTVTLTASPATEYEWGYWLVDGANAGSANPLTLTLTDHTVVKAVFLTTFIVNNFTDASGSETTPGTLRNALTNALDDDVIRLSGVMAGQTIIAITSRLSISKSLTIEGNGVTITRDPSWTTVDNSSQLLYVSGNSANVTIRRVWFKDGMATGHGAAIYNYGGTVSLESCIFSGNWNQAFYNFMGGGALYNDNSGTMSVKGCTFYGNRSDAWVGAIYCYNGTLTIEGNLFYGNTAVRYPVNDYTTSGGYNVVDVPFGTGSTQSGWTAATGDKIISALPVSPVTFKLLPDNGAANVITVKPVGYPTADFYGNPISAGAAAGAVQAAVSGSGYYFGLTVNDSDRGSVSASPSPNADGFVSGTVTLTASPATEYEWGYWLVDGNNVGSTNPLPLTLTAHTVVQAVFVKTFIVNNFTDASGSETTPGTLRHALTNSVNDDIIRLSGVTPGQTTIALTGSLPNITKSITIEGNGVTITRDPAWTAVSSNSQFLFVRRGAKVIIKRVWFKDGMTTSYGAAINNTSGTVSLESCIFSGNQNSITNYRDGGGALYNDYDGTMSVKGCTFYGNRSEYYGGAISSCGTIIFEGNLFYENTAASNYPVIYREGGTVTSRGYNVVDVPLGTGEAQSGWTTVTGDTTVADILGSNATSPFVSTTTLEPVVGIRVVMPSTPIANFPTTDFYGQTRTWPGAAGAVK
jgi:predicted outer membrane repeat protein